MIHGFATQGTEDIFNGVDSKAARKLCPASLLKVVRRKLDQIDSIERLDDLRVPPGNMLERVHHNREGQHSIRINDQYRIAFRWQPDGAHDVEITDYHHG